MMVKLMDVWETGPSVSMTEGSSGVVTVVVSSPPVMGGSMVSVLLQLEIMAAQANMPADSPIRCLRC